MNEADHQYLRALRNLMDHGVRIVGRNGHVTRKLFGHQMRFDLQKGFPLLTTKKLHTKSIIAELLWFIAGETNVRSLQEQGVHIWDEWADANGDLGPVYGSQWRSWPNYVMGHNGHIPAVSPIDQLQNVLASLKLDPFGRRHIVTAWNPAEVDKMALPPCHMMFQLNVRPGVDGRLYLDLEMYQRSADWFLGVPFNIASYALLLQLIAREVGYTPGEFVHSFGDYHLYENHLPQAKDQAFRGGRDLPTMQINSDASMFDLKLDDFELVGYDPWPAIRAEVAV